MSARSKQNVLLPLSAAAAFWLQPCPAADFTYGFECAEMVKGAPGEVRTFEVFATLTTNNNPNPDGAQSWSIQVTTKGAELVAISVDGLTVSTIFDDDGDPATPPRDPYPLDLHDAGFKFSEIRNHQVVGLSALSAVVLNQQKYMVLQPAGTVRIARLTLRATLPAGGDCAPVAIRFQDCNGGTVGECNVNWVTWRGMSVKPSLGSCSMTLCSGPTFRRCDPNNDGRRDIADAVWILLELFGADPRPVTLCSPAADCNGDHTVDVTDAVSALAYQFFGGPAPPPPFPQCGVPPEGIDPAGCQIGSTACQKDDS